MADDGLSYQCVHTTEIVSMKYLCYFLCAVLAMAFSSCGETPVETEKVVATTAKLYYEYLLQGKFEDFVGGIDHHVPAGEAYDKQLVDNAKLFVKRQEILHDGLVRIDVSDAEVDVDAHTANAFLVFSFADSTSEQVVVPMVERDGVWLMR